jgi:hypothetical protein
MARIVRTFVCGDDVSERVDADIAQRACNSELALLAAPQHLAGQPHTLADARRLRGPTGAGGGH